MDICQQYYVDSALYTEYDMTDKALKSLLIAAVDKTYIQSLQDKNIRYTNVTTKEMLAHLYLAYVKISDGDLEENDKQIRADYNVNQPMEVLFEQIDDSVDIAVTANNPYLAEQVVTSAHNLVFKTVCSPTTAKCGVDTTQPTKPGRISKHISLSRIRNSANRNRLPRE